MVLAQQASKELRANAKEVARKGLSAAKAVGESVGGAAKVAGQKAWGAGKKAWDAWQSYREAVPPDYEDLNFSEFIKTPQGKEAMSYFEKFMKHYNFRSNQDLPRMMDDIKRNTGVTIDTNDYTTITKAGRIFFDGAKQQQQAPPPRQQAPRRQEPSSQQAPPPRTPNSQTRDAVEFLFGRDFEIDPRIRPNEMVRELAQYYRINHNQTAEKLIQALSAKMQHHIYYPNRPDLTYNALMRAYEFARRSGMGDLGRRR